MKTVGKGALTKTANHAHKLCTQGEGKSVLELQDQEHSFVYHKPII